MKYNFVLVHFYANGQDSVAFHSDNEHWLGKQLSLSLRVKRDFHMKNLDKILFSVQVI